MLSILMVRKLKKNEKPVWLDWVERDRETESFQTESFSGGPVSDPRVSVGVLNPAVQSEKANEKT